jgi:uncharacterized protein YraI
MKRILIHTVAAAALLGTAGAAMAQATTATATTDLNVRSGPGPQFPVVGLIEGQQQTTVMGCIEGSKWCRVSHQGAEGWAYSDYLAADFSGTPTVVTGNVAQIGIPVTTYEDPNGAEAGSAAGLTTGAIGGAVAGALIAGPPGAIAGAAIGGTAGGVAGGVTGAVVEPPPSEVRTYVTANPVDPVYLDGEVVVGAGVPETVQLAPVPQYQYQYAYVNGQPVVVDPATRRIVQVLR